MQINHQFLWFWISKSTLAISAFRVKCHFGRIKHRQMRSSWILHLGSMFLFWQWCNTVKLICLPSLRCSFDICAGVNWCLLISVIRISQKISQTAVQHFQFCQQLSHQKHQNTTVWNILTQNSASTISKVSPPQTMSDECIRQSKAKM